MPKKHIIVYDIFGFFFTVHPTVTFNTLERGGPFTNFSCVPFINMATQLNI